LVALIVLTFVFLHKRKIFQRTFSDKRPISKRLVFFSILVFPALVLSLIMKNKQADFTNNLVLNELGKNGTFSFSQLSNPTN
jgi:hypothetical protein